MTSVDLPFSPQISDALTQTSEAIARLKSLTQIEIQPHWRWCLSEVAPDSPHWDWETAPLNEKQHIAWDKGQQVLWLKQRLVVPTDLQGYPLEGLTLRLALTWWAEIAQIFVDGELVQEGDLFDCNARILLRDRVQPGEEIDLAVRLVSPGHDRGALVRSLCLYERPEHGMEPCPEPGFVADELAVMQHYLETFAPERSPELAAAVAQIPWSVLPERETFDEAIAALRQTLLPIGNWLKQRTIYLLGHAHLDLAWLWTVDETWKAAERTFKSVLNLQAEFPELTFCHSSPALYAWVEEHRPDLFAAIQAQVQTGRWEIAAGMWVEPELNVISGESIARQILYGQHYVREKFGRVSKIAWLPDTFGFPWQLPQLLQQGGVEYFVTQKLRWNDTTEFPHEAFWWQAPNGSRVFSLHSAPIGEGIDPLKMTRYACQFEQKTGVSDALWLVGVGDHGGGPTRDMLEVTRRWGRSPFFPRLEFTTAERYLDDLQQKESSSTFPNWNDELYLEFHRGCYTTHADQKRFNRRCEDLLYQAELFASFATLATGATYPKSEIESAWKKVLFNQFHDILPGSAIAEVYEDANREWKAAEAMGSQLIEEAFWAIATHIQLPPPPHPQAKAIVVFNPLNWERSQVVEELVAGDSLGWQVCEMNGKPLKFQHCALGKPASSENVAEHLYNASFWAESIPALGYRCFWLCPYDADTSIPQEARVADSYVLENEFLKVIVDPLTGDLASVLDKVQKREVLSNPGNQLQAFRDEGQYWDAWNINPNYAQHLLSAAKLLEIKPACSNGALIQKIEVTRQIAGYSAIHSIYELEKGSAVLKIRTFPPIGKSPHTLVKAAFSFNIEADVANFAIPGGAMQRPTKPQGDREKAKWEVPAVGWANLSNDNCGVSLISDFKYGYDSQPHQLRLSLLRSSEWPDPDPEKEAFEFTYSLYSHRGIWQQAQTVRLAYELNVLLKTLQLPATQGSGKKLPPEGQFLKLEAENLVLTAFKQSEDDPQQWVLRCYECHGEAAELRLEENFGGGEAIAPIQISLTDLLEDSGRGGGEGAIATDETTIRIQPWQVATFKMSL